MQKRKALFGFVVFLLACGPLLFFKARQISATSLDQQNRITSFDKITLGRSCSPKSSIDDSIITIHGDGRVEYPPMPETTTVQLSPQQISSLITAVNESDYFLLAEKFNTVPEAKRRLSVTDTIFLSTSVSAEGKTQEIKHLDWPDWAEREKSMPDLPPRIIAFEKAVGDIVYAIPDFADIHDKWKGCPW